MWTNLGLWTLSNFQKFTTLHYYRGWRCPTFPTHIISQARNSANTFYFELRTDNLLPETWGKATLSVKTRFRAVLEAEIPELRLCAGHWKVDKLASITYPSWCGLHRKSDKVKLEDLEDDFDNDEYENNSDNEQLKRKRTATLTTTHSVKKPKPSSAVSVNRTTSDSGKGKSVDDRAGKIVKRQMPIHPYVASKKPFIRSDTSSVRGYVTINSVNDSFATICAVLVVWTASATSRVNGSPAPSALPVLSATSLPSTLPPLPAPFAPPPPPAPSPPPPSPPPSAALSAPPADSATPPLVLPPPPSNLSPPHLRKLDCLYLNLQQLQLTRPRAWNPSASSTSARGICAYDYKSTHKDATKALFDAHWEKISKDPVQKALWQGKELTAKAKKLDAQAAKSQAAKNAVRQSSGACTS
ncbi:hypothetical protein B0H19DRAFT_1248371 [Mycena capillaripes]|nr:hypothetical protein B0H19DRAFT_1248371 [Mycena capillaripes]